MLLRPDYHNVILKWANTHGNIFKIRLMNQTVVVLSDPLAAAEVMGRGEGSLPVRSHHYTSLDIAAGATRTQGSLFGTDDEEHWRAVRKETANAFSTANLRIYQNTVNAAVSEMLHAVEVESEALGSVEMDSLLTSMAMRVAMESQFQTTISEVDAGGGMTVAEGLEKMHYLMEVVNKMAINPVTHWFYTSMYTIFLFKDAQKFAVVREEVRGMYRKLAQLVVSRPVADTSNTMLWACLQRLKDSSGAPFNVEALIPDVGLFILAGLDTSAVTTAWCLYCAALYPQHQEAVYQELLAAGLAGPSARTPSFDDLSPLPITSAFVSEVMRLYPTAATAATRVTTKAAKIFCNKKNLLIPTGTTVWVPNYVLHNSNQNWDEARTFKPERWSSPDVQYSKGTKDKLRFTPFGQGIKGCIGQEAESSDLKQEDVVLPTPSNDSKPLSSLVDFSAKPPVRSTPPAPAKSTPPTAGSSSRTAATPAAPASGIAAKKCGHCGQTCTGLPLRCSQCKSAVFCSKECSKLAWPVHRLTCKPPASSASASSKQSVGSSPTLPGRSTRSDAAASSEIEPADSQHKPSSPSPSTAPAAAAAAAAAESAPLLSRATVTSVSPPSEEDETVAQDAPTTMSMQEALVAHLRQAVSNRTEPLDAQFQEAVVFFVQGEMEPALAQFKAVQRAAEAEGALPMQAEVYRWLGHTNMRLQQPAAAEESFLQGAAFAASHNLTKPHVECLCGLGGLHHSQGKAQPAAAVLREALHLAQGSGDEDVTALVMCNLGSVLLNSAPEESLRYLTSAVEIREAAVERIHASNSRDGLATAIMEHANTLVSLASTLYALQRFPAAMEAYEQSLVVFELVEDVERITKVLLNMHNMAELQMLDRQQALRCRAKLSNVLQQHHQRTIDSTCTICSKALEVACLSESEDKAILLLACLHGVHQSCFKEWRTSHRSESGDTVCPTCNAHVPVYDE
ncbi:MAG: hypothetical protein WDW36_002752 [Sanguina aurantia]